MGRGQAQCLGDPQRGLERQRRVEFRHGLAKFHEGLCAGVGLLDSGGDLDDAGSGLLAADAGAAPLQGEQHRMRGHRCMPHERRLLTRVEETHSNVMVRGARRERKRYLRVRELACDCEQSGIALTVRVQHDGCRIAGKTSRSKCVYLENTQGRLRSLWDEFCTHPRHRLHLHEPWGGLFKGLRCGKSAPRLTCEPVEPDPVNAGVGSR